MRSRGFLALIAALALVPLSTAAPAHAGDFCPNAQFRSGPSATLSDCRAFEMVSPTTKNGNDVSPLNTIQTAKSGDGAAYVATGGFLDSEASLPYSTYRSVRAGGSWSTRALTPPQTNMLGVDGGALRDLSADLTKGLAFSADPLAPGATAGNGNIYLQDNATGARRYVGGSADARFLGEATNTGGSLFAGADDSFEHVLIYSDYPLTPDAPAGQKNLYEIVDGSIRLANVLPDGNAVDSALLGSGSAGEAANHAISADGSRLFFSVSSGGPTQGVYMREGDTTTAISRSQRSGALPSDPPGYGSFGGASADGSTVFFSSVDVLTDAAAPTADPAHPPYRLYRWKSGVLTEIAAGSQFGTGHEANVLSVSDDGAYVYFLTGTALTGSGTTPEIYVWHQGDGVRHIATFESLLSERSPFRQYETAPVAWSISPDGRQFAFTSVSKLSSQPTDNPNCVVSTGTPLLSGHCQAVYLYSYGDPAAGPQCVSCDSEGAPPGHNSGLGGSIFTDAMQRPYSLSRYDPRAVFDDGTVYFDSYDRLVRDDGDGKRDVYRWRRGELTLISKDTATDSAFADASADQRDVFFVTNDRLVGADRDDNRDLYDARVGGGLASQETPETPAPCRDDACQDMPSSPPSFAPVGSANLVAPGNAPVPARARAARVTVSRQAVRGARFSLRTTVSGAGVVRASGSSIVTVRRRLSKGGSYALRVSLTRRARRSLARHHRIRVRVRVAFMPAKGKASATTVSLTVKA